MQNRIIGAIAPKGSGKTYAVAEYLALQDRFIVFDMLHESAYLGPADDVVVGNPKELVKLVREPQFRVVYRPSRIERDDKDNLEIPSFAFVVELAFAVQNMVLVIDEAHLLCDPHNIPTNLWLTALIGRHVQLSLVYVSHRFATIHRILTTNTDEFWFWRITEPLDLKGIAERCGAETAERARTARKLEKVDGVIVPGERVRWTVEKGLDDGEEDGNPDTEKQVHRG